MSTQSSQPTPNPAARPAFAQSAPPHNPATKPAPAPTSTAVDRVFVAKVTQCRFESCTDEAKNAAGSISSDGLKLKVDNFAVKISHELPGRLIVQYTDPATGKPSVFYRMLRDGVFELVAGQKPKAHWRYVEDITDLLQDRFGITMIRRNDPNGTYAEDSCQHEGPDGRHRFCFALTDGDMRAFLVDDIAGNFDPDSPEDMFFYTGEVEYRIRKATWTIIGTASTEADSSLIEKSILIDVDSSHPNLYLLALELDKYLHDHDHGSFDDYIGELKDLI